MVFCAEPTKERVVGKLFNFVMTSFPNYNLYKYSTGKEEKNYISIKLRHQEKACIT